MRDEIIGWLREHAYPLTPCGSVFGDVDPAIFGHLVLPARFNATATFRQGHLPARADPRQQAAHVRRASPRPWRWYLRAAGCRRGGDADRSLLAPPAAGDLDTGRARAVAIPVVW
jgi:hypothetical protein